eukprot:GILK01004840.1.p1 GENE.GILK01004840.1~~GILK01004840.1.p1  ORF type:complete len:196 (-),score=29.98 GILK01004840.1:91-678(-)
MSDRHGELLAVLDKIKRGLEKKGTTTIRSLGKTFRCLGSYDGDRKVAGQELVAVLRENGVLLDKRETGMLAGYLDREQDGNADFEEFLAAIRGSANPRRQALIDRSYLNLDKNGNGYIDARDIRGQFNGRLHPKVRVGAMTEDMALKDFLSHFSYRHGENIITREEWNDYYQAVSHSIDSDEHFLLLMKSAWQLD